MEMVATEREDIKINPRTRAMLMAIRQALLIALGALEDYLCVDRSVVPRRKRD